MTWFLGANADLEVYSTPFSHLTIRDVFPAAQATALRHAFDRCIRHGRKVGKVGESGNLVYDAINYTPTPTELTCDAFAVITAESLKRLIAGVLGVVCSEHLMVGLHRHYPPSKDGWPHTDCAIVSFPQDGPRANGMHLFEQDGPVVYADDSRDRQPETRKVARAIACLYYLGPQNLAEMQGGETALYEADGRSIARKIEPAANSLLAFEISPVSYHGYLGSALLRDSVIWWYHCEIDDLMTRQAEAFLRAEDAGRDPWDRWSGVDVPKVEVPVP